MCGKGGSLCTCFPFASIVSIVIWFRKKQTEFPSKLTRKTSKPDSIWPAAPVTRFHYFYNALGGRSLLGV